MGLSGAAGRQEGGQPAPQQALLGRVGASECENPSVFLAPVHVGIGDIFLIVTLQAQRGDPITTPSLLPGWVRGTVQGDTLHVLQFQLQLLALGHLVFLAVEEGHLAEAGVQVVFEEVHDLQESGAHLGVELPAKLHQLHTEGQRNGWGQVKPRILSSSTPPLGPAFTRDPQSPVLRDGTSGRCRCEE